jgi:hypothetical protein
MFNFIKKSRAFMIFLVCACTGYISNSSIALDVSVCIACSAGSYYSLGVNGTASCRLCLVGQYAPVSASLQCINCAVNSYASIGGATTCAMCQKFSSSLAASDLCTCDLGMCCKKTHCV